MKACLFLQRNFSRVGHLLARDLQSLGVDQFCAYSYPLYAAEFLRSQTDVPYSKILVDEEVISDYKNEVLDFDLLRRFEQDYGDPTLLRYIFMDRFIMTEYPQKNYSDKMSYSSDDALRLLQVRFKAIEKFLSDEKPDVVLFSAVALMSSLVLFRVAQKMGIRVLQIATTRVGDRVGLMEDIEVYDGVEGAFRELQNNSRQSEFKKQAEDFIAAFNESKKAAAYAFLEPYQSPGALKRVGVAARQFVKVISDYYTTSARHDYASQKPLSYFRERLVKTLRIWRGYNDVFSDPVAGEKYFFYPLHFDPEAATLVLAPYFTDQLKVIRDIAQSAPVDTKIYVKEHPQMMHIRPRSFYKALLNIPNVRVIRTSIPASQLIKKCEMVVTITSTAGWEACLLGKPVITLGNVFYNLLPTVANCTSMNDLHFRIQEVKKNFRENTPALVNLVSALFENSVSFDLYQAWQVKTFDELKKDRGILPLAQFVFERLHAQKKAL